LFDHATAQPAAAPAQFDFLGPQYSGAYKSGGAKLDGSCTRAWVWHVGIEWAPPSTLENFRFFGAPHVAIISTDRDLGVYGAIDCGAYVSNFALLAQSLGVASIPQAALAHYSPFVRQYFDLGRIAKSCAVFRLLRRCQPCGQSISDGSSEPGRGGNLVAD